MIILWNSSDMNIRLTLVDGETRQQYEWRAERSLANGMLAYLRDRLVEHNQTFTDITGIGVFRGPGSFTGLRIGMTVLNTLADTLQIPIVGAAGSDWEQHSLERLRQGDNDGIVLPEYGGEAHITKPRK